MLVQCKVCPATDHGSAVTRGGKAKPWRTIDIHCHCMGEQVKRGRHRTLAARPRMVRSH